MEEQELEGWGMTDTPDDGYASEGELNCLKLVTAQNKKKSKSGGFQSMGLSNPILRGIIRQGYQIPTPIQRKTIPVILEGKDVVAMARTGSGKSAAFLIPMLEKLKTHSAKTGIRALILSPTRELATQTLNFTKSIGRYTNLRAAVILGGESMDSQFAALHENPDIVIATPKRFKHVCLEMSLKLDTVEYVVFDEVDRLFEMQFSDQMSYILSCLSQERQIVLFSATLPKAIVEFSQIGLTNPVLIRLDVDTKISEKLELSFFQVSPQDKFPFLLYLLLKIVPPFQQTILFAPTRHHVEFFQELCDKIGIKSTYIFSALDPVARKINMMKFRKKICNLLIVTDIAARGLDIPLLDNVINFNFPAKSKLFVHRVGRAARAHRSGTAYSLVSHDESAFLLELHLFLNQSVEVAPYPVPAKRVCDRMFGRVPQDLIDENADTLTKLFESDKNLFILKDCADNSYKKYLKSRPLAAPNTIRRLKTELWDKDIGYHPLLFDTMEQQKSEVKRLALIDQLKHIRPKATIFEIQMEGKKGAICKFMEEKRRLDKSKIETYHEKSSERIQLKVQKQKQDEEAAEQRKRLDKSNENEIKKTFSSVLGSLNTTAENERPKKKRKSKKRRLEETEEKEKKTNQYIPYHPDDKDTEQGYSILSHFERETKKVAFDLQGDDDQQLTNRKQTSAWDRKLKKFVNTSNKPKKILTESGVYVDASYKKDLYAKWKLKMNVEGTEAVNEEGEERDRFEVAKKELKRGRGFVDLSEKGRGVRHQKLPQPKDDSDRKVKSHINSKNLIPYEVRNKILKDKLAKTNKEKVRAAAKQKYKKKKKGRLPKKYNKNF